MGKSPRISARGRSSGLKVASSNAPAASKSAERAAAGAAKASEAQVTTLKNWLQLGQLRSEKCELAEAKVAYAMALKLAKRLEDSRATMEALSGLLRLASEALDEVEVARLDDELEEFMTAYAEQVPPMAWYCKGAIAYYRKNFLVAQRWFHRYIRAVREERKNHPELSDDEAAATALAKGWIMETFVLIRSGRVRRARWLADGMLRQYEVLSLKGINGMIYLALGGIEERQRNFEAAFRWFQKSHASFLGEHNWFYHLYALYGYARLSRYQQRYAEAYWYLDLVEKATQGPEFGLLRCEILNERSRLEQDAIDLLIDSRQCLIKTRDDREISLGKQYVLLHILEALSQAHNRQGDDHERGLSKAEIIQYVWNEPYRPEAHDNKLYYNINRLRRLIEPDVKNPQILLNWKEGYRLAPGLKIKFVGGRSKPMDKLALLEGEQA